MGKKLYVLSKRLVLPSLSTWHSIDLRLTFDVLCTILYLGLSVIIPVQPVALTVDLPHGLEFHPFAERINLILSKKFQPALEGWLAPSHLPYLNCRSITWFLLSQNVCERVSKYLKNMRVRKSYENEKHRGP